MLSTDFFVASLKISIHKLSLNVLVKGQSSFTYIKVFIYDSFNSNQILLIPSGDVELNPDTKKSSLLTFFQWRLNGIAPHDLQKYL